MTTRQSGRYLRSLAPVLAWSLAAVGAGQQPPVPGLQEQTGPDRSEEPAEPGTSEVRVSEYMTVDLIVQNDAVTNVLHKLAIEARRNIVPSAAVDRVVNATIYDVPFYDALSGLLEPNGLGWIEEGDFIYVYTEEELTASGIGPWRPVTRIIHLDYLRPADARDFVVRLLSPEGHIEITKDLAGEGSGGDGGGGADQAAAAAMAQAAGAGGGGGGGGGGAGDANAGVYTPEVDEFALTNAVIVQDYEENVERIEAFLRELDTPPTQVLIEATVIQTTLNEANAFGVDFALLTGTNFVDFFNAPLGVPIGFKTVIDTDGNLAEPVLPDNEGFAISDPGNVGGGDATIRGGYIDDDIGVFIRALDQVTDVTLLSNPQILTLNRQRARVFVGTKVGYLETTVVENQVLQTVKFIDTGIILDIRPFVLRDGRIRLELSPQISDVVFRQFESRDGVVQEIPDERIQTVSTDVLVPGGYTAVIGGLFREDTSRTRSQVPVLGDLPLVGPAFRGHDDETSTAEVVFLIKPTVLEEQVIAEQGKRGRAYEEAVRLGSREGLLPWSRERQASRLNLEAERLLAQGRPADALNKIRRSLELHPVQPEVIRMSQEIVNDPTWWPTRRIMQRIIDGEAIPSPPGAEQPTEP